MYGLESGRQNRLKAEASAEKQGRREKIYIYIYIYIFAAERTGFVSNLVEAKPRECCFPLIMKSWATFVLKKIYMYTSRVYQLDFDGGGGKKERKKERKIY